VLKLARAIGYPLSPFNLFITVSKTIASVLMASVYIIHSTMSVAITRDIIALNQTELHQIQCIPSQIVINNF